MHILLNWILEGIALAAVTAAGLRLLRGAPAATRHGVCLAALLAILSLPLVPSLWEVTQAWATMPSPAPADAVALQGAATVPVIDAGWTAPLIRLPAVFSATFVLIGAAWMLWTMLQGVRVVRDVRWLRRAQRRCRKLPDTIAARFSPETRRLVADTRARVVLCREVRAAAVLGGGRPLIGLQPRLVVALSDRELNAVLVHELAHVVRHDARMALVQRAVDVLIGWHPAVWWVMRRLALEREMACDEAALGQAGGPKAYATCLTRIAELTQRAPLSPELAISMLPASGLHRRIVHILTPGSLSRPAATLACGALSTSLCVLAVAMGSVVVFGEPAMTDAVVTIEAVTSGLVQPRREAVPAAAVEGGAKAATHPAVATPRATRADEAPARAEGRAVARTGDQPTRASDAPRATQVSSATTPQTVAPSSAAPAGPVAASALPSTASQSDPPASETASAAGTVPAPAATPAAHHDRLVTDAALATAATATDAWTVTTGAAADAGVAVGRKTQQGATATAGAFARWGRRIAKSF